MGSSSPAFFLRRARLFDHRRIGCVIVTSRGIMSCNLCLISRSDIRRSRKKPGPEGKAKGEEELLSNRSNFGGPELSNERESLEVWSTPGACNGDSG
jgi:hypothetical protein